MLTKVPSVIPEFCKDCQYFEPSKFIDTTRGYCDFYYRQREPMDHCLAENARKKSASREPGVPPAPIVTSPDTPRAECPQAKTALILSILSLFCCGVILGPMALFKAIEAQRIILKNPHLGGSEKIRMAKILSTISIILWFVSIILQIVFFITGI